MATKYTASHDGHDAALTAEQKGNDLLARANDERAAGNHEKAERLYERGQKYLDRYNRLTGRA
jgi:hypothetical protein